MSPFDQVSRRARKLVAQGQVNEAIKLYQLFLQEFPKNTRAKAALGELRQSEAGDLGSPQQAYKHAKALIDTGEFVRAIAIAESILKKTPDNAVVWNLLGSAYFQSGNQVDSERCLRKALEINKNFGVAWANIAQLFYAQHRLEEALTAFQNASFLDSDNAGLYNSIGGVLISMGRIEEAEKFCVRAIKQNPNFDSAYINLANVFYQRKKFAAATQAFEKVLQLKPGYFPAIGDYFYTRAQICDWSEVKLELKAGSPVGEPGNSMSPFSMLHFEDDPQMQLKRSEVRALDFAVSNRFPPFQCPAVRPKKLKIGYFSADFHDHATLSLMMGVFGAYDKNRFEIHAYSYGVVEEGWRRIQLQNLIDKNWEVRSASDEEIVRHAREQGIDIAIDLKGYTKNARPRLFSYRVAPIQINYVGYPGTMGADFMDYLIADHTVISEEFRNAYSEKIIYMPNCYQPNDGSRTFEQNTQTRQELGLPESGFVFCSFNACYKISPREFDIWMRLLQKVEGSVLWLLKGNEYACINLCKEAELRGIDPDRLIFADKLPETEHLARHKHADLFLDAFNVNAHTTASDALWAGLPLVTLLGKQFAARVAASILKAANMPELVAKDEAEYEAIALDLALNPDKVQTIKQKVRAQIKTCPLFDTKVYTRDLEAGFDAAYERYLNGQEPDDIDLMALRNS